ncbi:MAG TPA: antitoxin Xre/MbcA/ParS toxin-binding domain-containing protein [Mucilaginibacter sp.]|jgi:putative toxin-antitoxin system antitoxin component (TIGR02293 family)
MEKPRTLDIEKLDYGHDESCKAWWYFMPDKLSGKKAACTERVDVINYLREGFPYGAVDVVLEKTCVSRRDLSNILHISTRQLTRYQHDDRLSAEQSNFLYELSRVYVRGQDIFGDQPTFEKWLQRPQMALGMEIPLNLLDTSEGFRMVNDVMSQIEYGFYS